MKFNHLNVPTHWQNYWTRYPEGHTILEALISWVSQVDSMVDNQNKLNDNVEQFRNEIDGFIDNFDERLQNEVTQTLNDWQTSGFLDVVISEALQWQLTDYIATNEADKASLTTQLQQIALNVKDFGATGDGVTDDTLALQTAFNHYAENKQYSVFLIPSGVYKISASLHWYTNKRTTNIVGSRRDTLIQPLNEFHTGIFTSDPTGGYESNVFMSGVRLDMADLLTVGIDATKNIYSIFEQNYITSLKLNSTQLKIGRWCNKVRDNLFFGDNSYLNSERYNIVKATAIEITNGTTGTPLDSVNDLIITGNSFTRIATGVKSTMYVNDVKIDYNTFDRMSRALEFTGGVKNLSFKHNYVEGVGGLATMDHFEFDGYVYTDGVYTRTINSGFILHETLSMGVAYTVSADFENNQFANCQQDKLIAVSNIKDFTFEKNSFYQLDLPNPPQKQKNIIYVFGKGLYRPESVLAVNTRYNSDITNVVLYDNNTGAFYINNGRAIVNGGLSNISRGITSRSHDGTFLTALYELSSFDSKHPHKIVVITGKDFTTGIINVYAVDGNENLVYQITLTNGSNVFSVPNTLSKSEFRIRIEAPEATIKNIVLNVANSDFPIFVS